MSLSFSKYNYLRNPSHPSIRKVYPFQSPSPYLLFFVVPPLIFFFIVPKSLISFFLSLPFIFFCCSCPNIFYFPSLNRVFFLSLSLNLFFSVLPPRFFGTAWPEIYVRVPPLPLFFTNRAVRTRIYARCFPARMGIYAGTNWIVTYRQRRCRPEHCINGSYIKDWYSPKKKNSDNATNNRHFPPKNAWKNLSNNSKEPHKTDVTSYPTY